MMNMFVFCICQVVEYVVVLDLYDFDLWMYMCMMFVSWWECFMIVLNGVNYYFEYYLMLGVLLYQLLKFYCVFKECGFYEDVDIVLGYVDVVL